MQVQHGKAAVVMMFCCWPTDKTPKSSPVWQTNIFVFKSSIIPPALPNRLIGACLSMWRLKTYERKQLLFSGFIGLTFDKSHDIVVRVEGNKILLVLLHKTSKGLIVRDIATGVKDCLIATLERISEFYVFKRHMLRHAPIRRLGNAGGMIEPLKTNAKHIARCGVHSFFM
jgi:hypothetical protein